MESNNELNAGQGIPFRDRLKIFLWLVPACFLLDFFTKLVVKNNMTAYGKPIELIENVARFRFIYNDGIAFGLKLGAAPHWVLAAVSVAVAVVLLWYFFFGELDDRPTIIAIALIISGAAGNLYDRIMFAKVVDFIEIGIGDLTWPVFNVADIAVTIGATILAFRLVFPPKKNETEQAVNESETSEKIETNQSA